MYMYKMYYYICKQGLNFFLFQQRAVQAETTVTRLKQEVKSLQVTFSLYFVSHLVLSNLLILSLAADFSLVSGWVLWNVVAGFSGMWWLGSA